MSQSRWIDGLQLRIYVDSDRFGDIITDVKAYSRTENGRSCVHRAKYLDELIQLIPDGVAEFNKSMTDMQENADGVAISFKDGTTTHASAVIACDGIKSPCTGDHPRTEESGSCTSLHWGVRLPYVDSST